MKKPSLTFILDADSVDRDNRMTDLRKNQTDVKALIQNLRNLGYVVDSSEKSYLEIPNTLTVNYLAEGESNFDNQLVLIDDFRRANQTLNIPFYLNTSL
ncbi:hypothetical protein GOV12_07565 [Candidatus Pacearchaeota archaeon]|nr:hypothetical protein [Candidatus Pacearchaeota archaeon]